MNAQTIMEYILPVAVSLMVLWVVYRLLFTNSNRFQFNRFYLLTAMLFSLALPLFGLLMGQSSPHVVAFKENLFNSFMLNEITITYGDPNVVTLPEVEVATPTRIHFSLWQVLGIIYLLGIAVSALLFLFKMGKLFFMIIRSPKRKMDGFTMVFTHKEHGPYSFFRYAFFPDEQVDPTIIRHEFSHISHHHSWDILMVELMKIFQWFNPFIYLYKRELQSLHEYIADDDVVATGADKRNYMMLILQQCTAVDFSDMSNNFSLILTKKRIKMITKHEKAKGFWWKLLATLPVLALLLIANTKVSAQEDDSKTKVDVRINSLTVYYYEQYGDVCPYTTTSIYEPDGSYYDIKVDEEAIENGTMRTAVTFTKFDKDGNPKVTHLNQIPFIQTESVSMKAPDNDSIYQIVEVMPEFPGGAAEMATYLSGNIKYPEQAKEKGISGRVFINFVIEKDGSVNQVKVMRGIGGGCDEEALRVVKAMPKWKPGMMKGKPVRVYYVLPVFFKLEDNVKDNGLSGTSWEGTGKGTKDKVNYTMHMTMEIESANSGYFVMTLKSEKKGKSNVEFEDVGLPFTYTFDGKSTGSINPTNPDGSAMTAEAQPPYGFTLDEKGNMIVNFYDLKEDIGVEKIVFNKTSKSSNPVRMPVKSEGDNIYDVPETMPEFLGGMDAMVKFMAENVKYPKEAIDKKIAGRVFVNFVVDTDGSIIDAKIERGIGGGCDEEALRVVNAMPKWKPGTMDGKPVKVRYMLPVVFKL